MSELKRILYVEDQADIQLITKMALENIGGFDIRICSSGEEAITAVESFCADLFLLDVMMPGMDGPETLAELWKNPDLKNTPVVFMTAKVQPDEVKYLMSLGSLDVISKPFNPMTLADTLRKIMAKN